MDNFEETTRREFRQRKKSGEPSATCCPVCGVTVRAQEFEHHYALEVERLHKLSTHPPKSKKFMRDTGSSSGVSAAGTSNATSTSPGTVNNLDPTVVGNTDSSWGTYQKIRANRQSRLKLKSRKRKLEEQLCPVCNERTTEDINVHVENCLKKSNGNVSDDDDDDESIDVEGEEYEWAGQTRIRTSTLLEGGYAGVGLGTSINSSRIQSDDDEDLNVDGDDTQVYGPSQYTEMDVIPITNDNKKEDSDSLYLRNLVIGNHLGTSTTSTTTTSNPTPDGTTTSLSNQKTEIDENHKPLVDNSNFVSSITVQFPSDSSTQKIIESLRLRIKELEFAIKNKTKCLICLDEYKIPVVSICCWHVHCEECWLRTLGARKLCPQCNMITSPTDLRRIYM